MSYRITPSPPSPPSADPPGRLGLLCALLLPAYELYNLRWMSADDAWASRRWSYALLVLGVCAASVLAAEALRRLGGRAAKWLAGLLFALSVLASPFLALMPLTGWGVPNILPNARGFAPYPSLPEQDERMNPAFREIRLIFNRYQSIMQGSSRITYIVGAPHRFWFGAYQALGETGPEGYRRCSITVPSEWARGECPLPAPDRLCFRCKSGNWNHNKSHLIVFGGGGARAVLYAGTGPSFELAVKDPSILELAASDATLRYPPATSAPDPDDEALFTRLASTSPVQRPLSSGEGERIKKCLFGRDLACLEALLRSDPSGALLAPFLNEGIDYERMSAALALATVQHPGALAHLLKPLENNPLDQLTGIATALSHYGARAAPALPGLIARLDAHHAAERWPAPAHLALVGPMLRIGTPEAFDYVGRFAERPMRVDEAEAIEQAFSTIAKPSPAKLEILRKWIRRQRDLKAPGAYPLLRALQRGAGTEAARPFLPWIREMQPKGNVWDAWVPIYRSLEQAKK